MRKDLKIQGLGILLGILFFYWMGYDDKMGEASESCLGLLSLLGIFLIYFQHKIEGSFFSARGMGATALLVAWMAAAQLTEFASEPIMVLMNLAEALCIAMLMGAFQYFGNARKSAAILLSICSVVLVLPFLMAFTYYRIYGKPFGAGALLLILQTNPEEAGAWMQGYLGAAGCLALGIALFLIFAGFLLFYARYPLGRAADHLRQRKRMIAIFSAGIMVLAVLLLPFTTLGVMAGETKKFLVSQEKFRETHIKLYEELKMERKQDLDTPRTIILVIGESASRDFMHFYTPSFSYENTPWMEEMRASCDFIFLQNSYASENIIYEAVSRALTEASLYHPIPLEESMTIFDLAKKSGYRTHCFTKQGSMMSSVSIVKVIEESAEEFEYIEEGDDGTLIDRIQALDPEDSHFVVLHLLGSHFEYEDRYPKEFARFDESSKAGRYANSILYTDHLLKEIYQYGKEHLNLQAMVYFSDHGENLKRGHGPGVTSFDSVRIPVFFYISPEYQEEAGEAVATLRKNSARYYSNDMIYHTVAGLLGMKSNHYDAKEDLSSKDYGFRDEDVLTFLGKRRAIEDDTER